MIKLSKKGDYALKTIIYLANLEDNSFFRISEISEKLNISESLLRRIVSELEKGGIIKTIKGRNGGISLGKKTSEISIFDIFISINEEMGVADCTKGLFCENRDCCDTTNVYNLLQKSFNGVLKIYTLDKILKK